MQFFKPQVSVRGSTHGRVVLQTWRPQYPVVLLEIQNGSKWMVSRAAMQAQEDKQRWPPSPSPPPPPRGGMGGKVE